MEAEYKSELERLRRDNERQQKLLAQNLTKGDPSSSNPEALLQSEIMRLTSENLVRGMSSYCSDDTRYSHLYKRVLMSLGKGTATEWVILAVLIWLYFLILHNVGAPQTTSDIPMTWTHTIRTLLHASDLQHNLQLVISNSVHTHYLTVFSLLLLYRIYKGRWIASQSNSRNTNDLFVCMPRSSKRLEVRLVLCKSTK